MLKELKIIVGNIHKYGDECEPQWCEECGHLTIYQITVTEKSRKMTPKFDRKKR